ncbi:hypothetical protein BD289DRAFT_456608 [Coniella lustricola]|uniref:LsmAD domain-containing protein n=1 Tax=Coniella lustricola TaxID=2025994 RepID=A0A2T2ZV54_9PEZI|nr:hypothetical protein BD289DRAFT_456608 [Coniella lustricola]
MVQPKKAGSADAVNGSGKRQSPMPYSRGNSTNRSQNDQKGNNRSGFQTDSTISSGRLGERRELQRWDAGDSGNGLLDGGLEDSIDSNKPWDQFAVNEKMFGLQTDYDENLYTTPLDRSRSDYREVAARADRLARRIENSNATSAHAAEERSVDHLGQTDDGADEEDKYSGVKRSDFPPLNSHSTNRYTPPARRAPTGSATVQGAPYDPAIISSQLRAPAASSNKQSSPKPDEAKSPVPSANKASQLNKTEQKPSETKAVESTKEDPKATTAATVPAPAPAPAAAPATPATAPATAPDGAAKAQPDSKTAIDKPTAALRASFVAGRNGTLATKENQPIEKELYAAFKTFGDTQRQIQKGKEKAAKTKKIDELKAFAAKFKLGTPVPNDLIGIIAKDPKKQQEIQDKARKNAEEVQRAKDEAKKTDAVPKEQGLAAVKSASSSSSSSSSQPKPEQMTSAAAPSSGTHAPAASTDNNNNNNNTNNNSSNNNHHNSSNNRGASRAGVGLPHPNASGPGGNRHPGNRQSYAPGNSYQQQFRGDRVQGQHMPRHNQQGGHLAQQLRNVEQQRMMQPPHRMSEMRLPPTGPANNSNNSNTNNIPIYAPRHAGISPSHMGPGPRLNPNTQEFRPNAQPFIPAGPSAASSPRSALNTMEHGSGTAVAGIVVRRKVKTIDVKKCFILGHVESFKPPQPPPRSWEENGGLRPAFDTMPTWKSIREEDNNKDKIGYKQLFERPPFAGAMVTPNAAPVVPQMAHQHQLPFHLQQGAQNVGPRQSPHMPPMQMHTGHPSHAPHVPFSNGDDGTRMTHSNSAQSYASPRPGQAPMAHPNMINSPSHMPFSQPVMPGFMGPVAPPMGPQMRNFGQSPQYIPQQHGQMGPPMMMAPGYMAAPGPMMQGSPQMPMYPGAHPNFMPGGPMPPQAMQGANGYPSPGRPVAPMMAHQGSQQGQHMYGMSPGMPQYQQPVFAPQQQQPGQTKVGNMRVHSNPGPQHLGTSPQQVHHHGSQHRGNNGYGGKNYSGPHQGPSPTRNGPQTHASNAQDDAK